MKALNFDAITTMTMGDDEGTKNKEHVDDCISESDMKTSSKNTINKICKSTQRSYNLILH